MDDKELSDDKRKYLQTIYNNPKDSGSFGGVDNLYKKVKSDAKYDINKEQVKHFLLSRDEYTLHKPVVHKFPTHHIIVGGPNQLHQGDLVDMGRGSSKHNDNVHFLFCVIDCFTKMAYVQPLENKSGKNVLAALEIIYRNKDTPTSFTTDSGKEFTNHLVQKWLKDNNVHFYIAHGTHKAMFVERFHKSLKSRLSRYMTLHNSLRYIDILQDVVTAYNNTYSNVTGHKPVDVDESNAKEIFIRMFGSPNDWFKNLKEPKFKIGDHVRLTRSKGKFEKGYEETFTREVYTISGILNTNPREYKVKSLKGEKIEGRFYEKELGKIVMRDDAQYQIEKIIKERRMKGKKQYFVKYKGWDASHNEWVNEDQLSDI